MRVLTSVTTAMALVTCTACGTLPKEPSTTDARTVYVWPAEVCPSQAAGSEPTRSVLLGGLATTFIGNIISSLVGIPSAALTAAADADTKGLKASGTNARYYYELEPNAANASMSLIVPRCYIVAYARPLSAPNKNWCDDADFAKSVPKTCSTGRTALTNLKIQEQLSPNPNPKGIDYLSVPEIYMEIGYKQSSFPEIVRPEIVAMHYPKSVIEPDSKEPRAISLQLDFTSPLQPDTFKAAQVAIVLPSVTPAPVVDTFALDNVITGWTTIPSKGSVSVIPTPPPKSKEPFLPVTIKASLNESGDPHVFLQAFAKAFGNSVGDYSKTISNEVTPLGQITSKQTQDKNKADYTTALGAAQKSRADLLTACANNPQTPQAKAAAKSLFTIAIANQQKANLAAEIAGEGNPYLSAETVDGAVTTCWQ